MNNQVQIIELDYDWDDIPDVVYARGHYCAGTEDWTRPRLGIRRQLYARWGFSPIAEDYAACARGLEAVAREHGRDGLPDLVGLGSVCRRELPAPRA